MSNDKEAQESEKRRSRFWPVFRFLLPYVLVGTAILSIALLFLPVFGKPLLSLVTRTESNVSEIALEEMKDIYRFSTIEYFYRVVFPYDLLDQSVSQLGLLQKLRRNVNKQYSSYLTEKELEYLRVFKIAKDYSLNLGAPDYHFLVATVILRAGFPLDGLSDNDSTSFISSESLKTDNKTILTASVKLPQALILDKRVEDPLRSEYPFPDVPITPQGWRDISALLLAHAEKKALEEGILSLAEDNAKSFFDKLLKSAGYQSVVFTK